MAKFFISTLRSLFLYLGALGTSQMCFGYLHEVSVPEDLKKKEYYEN